MSAHAYQPRLLLPQASGIPSHIRVSHDANVYRAFNDPAVTAVVYVPLWSQGACAVFNQQAAARYTPQPHYAKNIDHIAGFEETLPPLLSLLRAGNIEHLHHELFPRPDSAAILDELAGHQALFLEAVAQQLGHPDIHARFQVVDFMADASAPYVHQPHLPQTSMAHTDMHATGLFSHPVGTILVDHDGLDIQGLRESIGGGAFAITLQHLANRLWQIPNASFALWRGEREGNAQYHFIPAVVQNTRRARLFALT